MAHEGGAVADEIVRSGRARVERRARHRHDFPALFPRHPRRDQRPGPLGCLGDDGAAREAGDDAVKGGCARALCPNGISETMRPFSAISA